MTTVINATQALESFEWYINSTPKGKKLVVRHGKSGGETSFSPEEVDSAIELLEKLANAYGTILYNDEVLK